jgi:LacI family transcriptional regulator
VSADNEEGGRLAARHLISLGHTRIAHITGPNVQGNLNDRARGFLRVAEASGMQPPVVLRGEHSFAGGCELTRRILERHPERTAIFAGNDAMAFGALRAVMDAGKRVPDDISLVAFDNVDLSAITSPPLTTVHQPKYEMGRAAVEMLLAVNGHPSVPEHRVLGVQLIVRQSCRKV